MVIKNLWAGRSWDQIPDQVCNPPMDTNIIRIIKPTMMDINTVVSIQDFIFPNRESET